MPTGGPPAPAAPPVRPAAPKITWTTRRPVATLSPLRPADGPGRANEGRVMTGRVWRVGGLLLLGACGCLGDEDNSLLVSPSPFGTPARSHSSPAPAAHAPA